VLDAIVINMLNWTNIIKRPNRGKSMSDNSWGKYADMLLYKETDRCGHLVKN